MLNFGLNSDDDGIIAHHVVFGPGASQDAAFCCEHCNQVFTPDLPMDAEDLNLYIERFVVVHAACPRPLIVLSEDKEIKIPEEVGKCPYCSAGLTARVTGSVEQPDGSWAPDEIQLDCNAEPQVENRAAWNSFLDEHSDMPYVYWLPVETEVLAWIQARYRVAQTT